MTERLNLVVAGSRDLNEDTDYSIVADAIDLWCTTYAYGRDIRIVEGGARGADRIGYMFSCVRLLAHRRVPAAWTAHGKAAGPIRNQAMIADADGLVVVRFADSRGSADVLRRAKAKGIPVIDVVLERKKVEHADA